MPSLPLAPPLSVRTHCPYCAYQCGMIVGDGSSDAPAGVQGAKKMPTDARTPSKRLEQTFLRMTVSLLQNPFLAQRRHESW